MGTSQSHSLKTTPQWTSAKKALTAVIKNEGNTQKHAKLMSAFGNALGNEVYRGSTIGGKRGTFGYAGAKALHNTIQFISDVRSVGINAALNNLGLLQANIPTTPRELIRTLCGLTAEGTGAFADDEAAVVAQESLLAKIFTECSTLQDVESILINSDDDTIDVWIIDFQVEYIVEYMGGLFQSHIFDKNADPEMVCNDIKDWLHSELDNRLAAEMTHIDIFSQDGKAYIESLTLRILKIWQ